MIRLEQFGSLNFRKNIGKMCNSIRGLDKERDPLNDNDWKWWIIGEDFNLSEFKKEYSNFNEVQEFEYRLETKKFFLKLLEGYSQDLLEKISTTDEEKQSKILYSDLELVDDSLNKLVNEYTEKMKNFPNLLKHDLYQKLETLYKKFNSEKNNLYAYTISSEVKEKTFEYDEKIKKINKIKNTCKIINDLYTVLFPKKEKLLENVKKIVVISSEVSLGKGDFEYVIKKENKTDNISYDFIDPLHYENIVTKIQEINNNEDKPDLIAFIRGGSSQNSPITQYNHPDFINAIIESEIPILLGIGHADDDNFLICNEFADYTAITPSEAARKCIELIEQSNNLT